MKVRAGFSPNIALATLVTLGSFAAFSPADAQKMENEGHMSTDPAFAAADMDQPRNEFRLYPGHDKEVVKYKQSHTLSLCVGRADPASVNGTKHAYPVTATYDGQSTTVQPGQCATFKASQVILQAATSIPQNDDILGKISIVK